MSFKQRFPRIQCKFGYEEVAIRFLITAFLFAVWYTIKVYRTVKECTLSKSCKWHGERKDRQGGGGRGAPRRRGENVLVAEPEPQHK